MAGAVIPAPAIWKSSGRVRRPHATLARSGAAAHGLGVDVTRHAAALLLEAIRLRLRRLAVPRDTVVVDVVHDQASVDVVLKSGVDLLDDPPVGLAVDVRRSGLDGHGSSDGHQVVAVDEEPAALHVLLDDLIPVIGHVSVPFRRRCWSTER